MNVEILESERDKNEQNVDDPYVKYEHLEKVCSRAALAKYKGEQQKQMDAMKKGFNYVISVDDLAILYPEDLQNLTTGSKMIDLNDWRANTLYTGIYKTYKDEHGGADHPSIEAFWSYLAKNSERRQLELFKYATAYRRVPVEGFGNLKDGRKFTINPFLPKPLEAKDEHGKPLNDSYLPDADAW